MVTRVQGVWVAVSRGLCLAEMTGVLYVSFGMCDGDKSSGRLGRSQSWPVSSRDDWRVVRILWYV